jgi:aminomethyltransferase
VVTRRVSDLAPNQIRYGLVCKEDGGILDDVLVYGASRDGACPYAMVVNASNREKIVAWLEQAISQWQTNDKGLSFGDDTLQTAMIAVQGPNAADVLSPFFMMNNDQRIDLSEMKYYHCRRGHFDSHNVLVSRTGYTGEDGFEIICANEAAAEIWERTIDAAAKVGGIAAGLGARDTLRLEAAMPLYGHELSETINPIQAGLNFAVNLKDRQFIGRDALERFANDKTQPVRIGLQAEGKRVPRQGCPVLHNGQVVGEVTSGTFSPTFEKPIAMAYVRPAAAAVGTKLAVDIRGTQCEATVVPLPFYKRT